MVELRTQEFEVFLFLAMNLGRVLTHLHVAQPGMDWVCRLHGELSTCMAVGFGRKAAPVEPADIPSWCCFLCRTRR
jgi:hypothetical protein